MDPRTCAAKKNQVSWCILEVPTWCIWFTDAQCHFTGRGFSEGFHDELVWIDWFILIHIDSYWFHDFWATEARFILFHPPWDDASSCSDPQQSGGFGPRVEANFRHGLVKWKHGFRTNACRHQNPALGWCQSEESSPAIPRLCQSQRFQDKNVESWNLLRLLEHVEISHFQAKMIERQSQLDTRYIDDIYIYIMIYRWSIWFYLCIYLSHVVT